MAKKERKVNVEQTTNGKQVIDAIGKISEAITSDLYIEDILKLIVTVTAEAMDSKICSLMLLDKATKELEIKATQSVSKSYNKKPNIKLGEGIAGEVARSGKPITALDVRKDERYINREIAKKENLRSLLSVPLMFKGNVIGVLNSYTAKMRRFTKNEINILKSIANQAAVVIENFRLVVESRVIKEELETRKAVERAKDILMKEMGFSGEDAYRKIQKQSMNTRRTMREIAEAIILAKELKSI